MTVCREVLKEQHALMVPTEHNPHDSQRELGEVSLACSLKYIDHQKSFT